MRMHTVHYLAKQALTSVFARLEEIYPSLVSSLPPRTSMLAHCAVYVTTMARVPCWAMATMTAAFLPCKLQIATAAYGCDDPATTK